MLNDGWLVGAKKCPSPNFNSRPADASVDLLVIHNISLPPGEFGGACIEQFFCNQLDVSQHPYFETIADVKVSSHLLIDRQGQLTQFVSFDDRAWHAGESCFQDRENCNDFSIGIELEGEDHTPYTDAQYAALTDVSIVLCELYPALSLKKICGHSDIAPSRKTDPGPAFDWSRYQESLGA